MQIRVHFLLITSIAAAVIALRVVGKDYYRQDYARTTLQGATVRQNEIEQNWQSVAYTNGPLRNVADLFLNRIDWGSLGLPGVQQEKLKSRIRELFSYFNDPTFDTYYRLKTDGLSYEFHPGPEATRLLALGLRGSRPKTDLAAKDATKVLWQQVRARAGNLVVPRITAISLDRVAYNVNHTNSGKALLKARKVFGFTVGRQAVNPGFQYLGIEGAPNGAGKDPLLFDFGFLAKLNGTDTAGPMFVSLCWSEKDQTWALNRLITDNLLGISTLF